MARKTNISRHDTINFILPASLEEYMPTIKSYAVFYGKSGRSVLEESVTADNIKNLLPTQETIDTAVKELCALGFAVSAVSKRAIRFSALIEGEKELFENVFNTALGEKTTDGKTYYTFTKQITIPDSLKKYVAGIALLEPHSYCL